MVEAEIDLVTRYRDMIGAFRRVIHGCNIREDPDASRS